MKVTQMQRSTKEKIYTACTTFKILTVPSLFKACNAAISNLEILSRDKGTNHEKN